MSLFVRLAGFSGLLVCLDEMVNLYKMSNTQARNANYEQILRILNDTLQGNSEGLGFLMGGTPEWLMDTRSGLYSYDALRGRLAENAFAKNANLIDYSHPVLRLSSLSQEDFLVLLGKILDVFAYGDPTHHLLPEEALIAFMNHCHRKIGEAYFRTPRTTITAFVNLLSVLEQNPSCDWRELLGQVEVKQDLGGSGDLELEQVQPGMLDRESAGNDEFTTFRL
jgi:hypothetical protein